MKSRVLRTFILLAIIVTGPSLAQRLPGYYPDSFQRIGTVDDISSDRIVINDVPYALSNSVVVHALFAEEILISILRRGTTVGYLVGENRQVVEIWQLPNNYKPPRNRR